MREVLLLAQWIPTEDSIHVTAYVSMLVYGMYTINAWLLYC